MNIIKGLLRRAAAGAAGTTALNMATYIDVAARGRDESNAPKETVEALTARAHLTIPGNAEHQSNRVSGLCALSGIVVGIGVGAGLGIAREAGWRPTFPLTGVVAALIAMCTTDGPMALLGVTDPRSWLASDWLSDALPHLAYGAVTAAVLEPSAIT